MQPLRQPSHTPTPQPYDPMADTRPHRPYDPLGESRYHRVYQPPRPRRFRWGCALLLLTLACLALASAAYLFAPLRTNVLLLGIDARPGEANYGRTDTMILTTVIPLQPYVGMLSIPRDLWVTVPGYGENRINTAHFFAEIEQPGSGPTAAVETVRTNFGVDIDYTMRIDFDNFQQVVDAIGGLEIVLPRPMSGYPEGSHQLTGEQALALVRDRQGSDDFGRMERAHLFLRSTFTQVMRPANWRHLPVVLPAIASTLDTDIPIWLWPRLGLALLRAGGEGLDSRTITREMVTPFRTEGGAAVLNPRWELINPVLMEMFGQ